MRYIMSVDGMDFYWKSFTNQVLLDEHCAYRVIGYAGSEKEAREVIEAWML